MNTTVRIILAVLACYRLARLFVEDDGPFGIFDKWRDLVGANVNVVHGPMNAISRQEYKEPDSELGKLFECQYCIGVWCAVLCAVLVAFPTLPGDAFLIWLAIAGGQSWLASTSH